jgi:bifunctional oligoribonuclease and PAP phosphatase NrnA
MRQPYNRGMSHTLDYSAVTRWLEGCRRPMVVSHRRPDGDPQGAIAGLCLALRARRIEASPVLYESFPARYRWLGEQLQWRAWPADAEFLRAVDAVIILDTCARQQLEPIADFLPQAPRTLVIDHHATRDDIATRPEDLRLFDDTASAASLLVAEWVCAAGIALTPQIARALFTGIATDCGWFRFSNTDARTLHVAADLVRAGAPPAEIHAELYQQDSGARLRLIARALLSLELHASGRLAVMRLRRSDYEAAGAGPSDSEDVVNEAGRLAEIEATILFNEEPDGSVRVNLRSRRVLDVAQLAADFGGGGHARAAGARLRMPLAEAEKAVLARVLPALGAEPVT